MDENMQDFQQQVQQEPLTNTQNKNHQKVACYSRYMCIKHTVFRKASIAYAGSYKQTIIGLCRKHLLFHCWSDFHCSNNSEIMWE